MFDIAQQKLLLSQSELENAANDLKIQKQNEEILKQRFDSSQQATSIVSLKKENTISSLELINQKLENTKKSILLTVVGIVSVLLILLLYSYYRRYKLKREKQLQVEILAQQELATKAILEAEENERKRIASDLHDGVGQIMSAAKMNLSAMEAEIPFATDEQRKVYEKVLKLVDEGCKEVRSVSHNMMPNALVKAGLASAVKEFVNQIDARVVKTDFYTEGLDNKLEKNVETVLYRIIQECVNNVIKHAKATHLDISLIKDNDGVAVTIEDNGIGFDSSNKNNFNGIGLKNIQTRVEFLKGTVEWNSSVGKGTLVAIHIPIGS
ncbi:MAG: sensor histidine kinase [Chitinophagaceae bacterium]